MIGMFLTNVSHLHARYYWSAMFPIFGIVSLWHELLGPGRHDPVPVWRRILRQALHWLGPIVAVRIIFLQLARGQMDADAVALVTLVILAVTCFMAGVHMDSSFYWVSRRARVCRRNRNRGRSLLLDACGDRTRRHRDNGFRRYRAAPPHDRTGARGRIGLGYARQRSVAMWWREFSRSFRSGSPSG